MLVSFTDLLVFSLYINGSKRRLHAPGSAKGHAWVGKKTSPQTWRELKTASGEEGTTADRWMKAKQQRLCRVSATAPWIHTPSRRSLPFKAEFEPDTCHCFSTYGHLESPDISRWSQERLLKMQIVNVHLRICRNIQLSSRQQTQTSSKFLKCIKWKSAKYGLQGRLFFLPLHSQISMWSHTHIIYICQKLYRCL